MSYATLRLLWQGPMRPRSGSNAAPFRFESSPVRSKHSCCSSPTPVCPFRHRNRLLIQCRHLGRWVTARPPPPRSRGPLPPRRRPPPPRHRRHCRPLRQEDDCHTLARLLRKLALEKAGVDIVGSPPQEHRGSPYPRMPSACTSPRPFMRSSAVPPMYGETYTWPAR